MLECLVRVGLQLRFEGEVRLVLATEMGGRWIVQSLLTLRWASLAVIDSASFSSLCEQKGTRFIRTRR